MPLDRGRAAAAGLLGFWLAVAPLRAQQEPGPPPASRPAQELPPTLEGPPAPAAPAAPAPGVAVPATQPPRPAAGSASGSPAAAPAGGSPVLGRIGDFVPLPIPGGRSEIGNPGMPASRGRPMPGSPFDPGASGPGLGYASSELFLDGALDPRTGWPFVFLDHFAPRPERVANFWIVQTRDCPQVMGSDPWPCLKVLHFDARGNLVERPAAEMFAQTVGRPVFVQVQGSLTTADIALGGLMWSHSWLQYHRALTPDAVVIAFDWPSERIYKHDERDINEKGRRAYVAGYHLARFVQGFPPGSRVCLLGQSFGGRVVPSALHLLGGGRLNSQDHDLPVGLPGLRPDLHLRAVAIAGASDHQWLDPGERLDRALYACEAFLNLYNRRDEALLLYAGLRRSGHHRALGRIGLTNRDFRRLGPVAARYEEHDLDELLGNQHTLLDAVANPQIARWIAPYAWAPDPGPAPPMPEGEPEGPGAAIRRRLRGILD